MVLCISPLPFQSLQDFRGLLCPQLSAKDSHIWTCSPAVSSGSDLCDTSHLHVQKVIISQMDPIMKIADLHLVFKKFFRKCSLRHYFTKCSPLCEINNISSSPPPTLHFATKEAEVDKSEVLQVTELINCKGVYCSAT